MTLHAAETGLLGPRECPKDGVSLQFLGSGGPEPNDRRASSSYVVRVDGVARVLIDPAPGAALRMEEYKISPDDLVAVLISQTQVDHVGDLPALLQAAIYAGRKSALYLLGPEGNANSRSVSALLRAQIGSDGAYPQLAELLPGNAKQPGAPFAVEVRDIMAIGDRRWAEFGIGQLQFSAIPVKHGDLPALAWRVDVAGKSITFAGDGASSKATLEKLARGTDMLVIHHAIPEGTRGDALEYFMTPTQIGRVAALAQAKEIFLSHRMIRTVSREPFSRDAIEANYHGRVSFANDGECWGLE